MFILHIRSRSISNHMPWCTCGVSFSHCRKECVLLCHWSSAVVDPSCVSFITMHVSIVWNRPWGFCKAAGGGRCCWQTLEKPVLLLLTLFSLQLIKKAVLKKKKKVLLGCTCFSRGCAAGGKQMVPNKWMGVRKQAPCVASRPFAMQTRGLA